MDGPLAYLDTWALHAILLISPPNTSNSLIAFIFLLSRRSITCPVCRANVADALVHIPASNLPAAPRRMLSRRPIATSELLPIARIPTIQSCGPGTAVPARPFQPQEPLLPVTLEASCQIGSSGR
ncbi:hypothetical protein BFJ65_g10317 [Fusarium oxysporum f. sp. cepae]|uniref:Uncharacterized protein n=1 Tax=Fusarium oxysporum f. sp. cepae TaxID=396571 RepID=A0A3L6NFR9_FUSOX|nr:hypothetical protein BFJ65_g10317 [Fusarium oxysporum f. sp. cepae]